MSIAISPERQVGGWSRIGIAGDCNLCSCIWGASLQHWISLVRTIYSLQSFLRTIPFAASWMMLIDYNHHEQSPNLAWSIAASLCQKRYAHQHAAHQKSIISVSPLDSNLFYTSSEDATLRLWDLRLHSSVKLFKHASLNTLSNCDNDGQHVLYVGCNSHVYSFDSRK